MIILLNMTIEEDASRKSKIIVIHLGSQALCPRRDRKGRPTAFLYPGPNRTLLSFHLVRPYVADYGIAKQFDSDLRTGLGIRKCMMMVHEVISAGCRDRLELMVWKASAEIPPRRCKGIVKFVVGIVHLIYLEDSLEAALVETGVVCN